MPRVVRISLGGKARKFVNVPEFLTETNNVPGSFQTWRRGFRRAVRRSGACPDLISGFVVVEEATSPSGYLREHSTHCLVHYPSSLIRIKHGTRFPGTGPEAAVVIA
jgi:hypothetical protein